jgi:hypothetical protein
MAVYKIFPEKDATMYSLFPEMNTGIDEILDISNLNFAVDTNPEAARYLIKFDQSALDDLIINKANGASWDIDLRCFIATAQGINLDSRIYIYPVSGSWGMGTGKYLDVPVTTNGVSWKWQTVQGGKIWDFQNFAPYVTSSYTGSNRGGGTFFTGSDLPDLDVVQTQTFSYHSDKDLNVRVTDTVKAWYTSSLGLTGSYTNISNEGFLVKWEGSCSYEDTTGNYYAEFNPNRNVQPVLQYYSMDTHTIYPPCLDFKWDDSIWNTGSSTFPVVDTPQVYASIMNNGGFFYSQSVQEFRIDCRPQFPPIIFQTASIYTNNYYLPSGSSYWAIKDLSTNEYIIDFDSNYTKISADSSGSFFTVYMNGLQPERYYTILLQTTIGGTTMVLDSNYNFKVING